MNSTGKRQSSIARIWALLNQPQHPYRPATTVFLDVNVDRVADELQLVERGRERGSQNRPTADAQTMDDVEQQIVEKMESHKQVAHNLYVDELHIYDTRTTALGFEEHFATIQQAAPEAVGDFAAEATIGRDELFALRRRLNESEAEREQFRTLHRIERPARLATLGKNILKIGILAVLFIVEVVVNAGFLAESNVGGYLGGLTQAVTFATLNIIASFLWGMALIRLVFRRSYFLKMLGALSFIAYTAFAVVLNLALAHLREIPAAVDVNSGQEVMRQLLAAPLVLIDVKSWILFSIGFIFSVIAMVDGLLFLDPYIGYAGLERRWIEASRQFAQTRADLIDRLRDIRDDAIEAMNAATRDLSKRRDEHDSILAGRSRLTQLFSQHQNQIEQACRALLEIYRETNRGARSAPAPGYFTKPYSMERIVYTGGDSDSAMRDHLRQMISETQELLKQQISAIQAAFDGAVQTYREIDDLFPEVKRG